MIVLKRLISILLVILVIFSSFVGLNITSSALSSSGNCGTNVTFTFTTSNDIGVLTISGTGAMYNYSSNNASRSPFSSVKTINYVIIKSGITSIGDYAFYGCSGLKSVTIPDSVISIGSSAFRECRGLTSFTTTNFIRTIGDSAFQACTRLTSFTIPNSVTSIGESVFKNCGLTDIIIPNTVKSIGGQAFYGCSGLTSITIPDSVTSIDYSAFCFCSNLTNVDLGNSVNSLGDSVFSDCSSLNSMEIPDSTSIIGSSAFSNCSGLTNVTIGHSVKSLPFSVFNNCSGLTSIIIPDSVTSIGGCAFQNCKGLTKGYTEHTCSRCGDTYNDTETEMIEHTVVTDTAVEPTCRATGLTEGSHCSVCGTVLTAQTVIPLTNHCYETTNIATTCVQKGFTLHTCMWCGDAFKSDYSDIGEHSYVKTITTPATCSKEGVETFTCTICGDKYTKSIAMIEPGFWNIQTIQDVPKTSKPVQKTFEAKKELKRRKRNDWFLKIRKNQLLSKKLLMLFNKSEKIEDEQPQQANSVFSLEKCFVPIAVRSFTTAQRHILNRSKIFLHVLTIGVIPEPARRILSVMLCYVNWF